MAQEPGSPKIHQLLDRTGAGTLPGRLNRTVLLTLEAVTEALADAGLSKEDLADLRTGVILGTTVGCTFNNEQYYTAWRDRQQQDLAPVQNYLDSNLARVVQNILGASGPAAVITNACSSGTDAIGLAKLWLEQDRCDLVIAGGADELSRIAYHGFASLMLLSESRCRPFDTTRNGLNLGEGAGILILEREDHIRDGALPKGCLLGYGAGTDGYHPTAPHPEGRGLKTALRQALADSRTSASGLAYINAHGTGTPANDIAEATALADFQLPESCAVVSTKGITGHMLGAAGAVEAVITLLSLGQGLVSGTWGCRDPDPAMPLPIMPESRTAELTGKLGISQSLAFGGFNGVLVLEALP
jgi:3-oxoacyl-[acyl-carrier-protein] synthase-1/3-oxoacyl-[acyl-carrier-protein] synthase II